MTIQLKDITKKFDNKVILDQVNATVPVGKIVGLIGPNGVGKTTLMRIMCHLDTQYTGEVYFGHQSNEDQSVFNRVSFMQDQSILYPQLTGYQHLTFLASVHQVDHSRIEDIIHQIGIESYCYHKTATYSLGMKQHLLIAMVILSDPDYLILDEPYNGLDPSSVIRLKAWMREWAQQGKTILLSSHNLSLVSDLTDLVYFLKDGNLTPFQLDDSQRWAYLLTTNNDGLFHEALQREKFTYQLVDEKIKITGDIKPYLTLISQSGLNVIDIQPLPISLEHIYHDLYR